MWLRASMHAERWQQPARVACVLEDGGVEVAVLTSACCNLRADALRHGSTSQAALEVRLCTPCLVTCWMYAHTARGTK